MKELLPGLLAWVKIGDDLFQIDEQLDNFIRATCGSSYRVELRKADTKWVVNNAMNGWGNNCYDEWMDKEVTLLYESPKEPAAPQTDAVLPKTLTDEHLLQIFKSVSLFDLSECAFEYGNDARIQWINAQHNGRVIDAITYNGNTIDMMDNDGTFHPLNPQFKTLYQIFKQNK